MPKIFLVLNGGLLHAARRNHLTVFGPLQKVDCELPLRKPWQKLNWLYRVTQGSYRVI